MVATELKPGQKVKNQYGRTMHVIEVIDGLMVRTLEDSNNLYHCTKLFIDGYRIEPRKSE